MAETSKYSMREILLSFVYKYKGDWMETYNALDRKDPVDDEIVAKALKWVKRKKLNYIALVDADYPEKYKGDYQKPPFVIFIDEDGNEIKDTEMTYPK